MHKTFAKFFEKRKILITGGLGFIGSSLAQRLNGYGAMVTVMDAMIPGYGGNLFNIHPASENIRVNFSDITDENATNHLVRDSEIIFHCAGQVSHVKSLTDPFPDIDINIKGTAVLMEACRKFCPNARVVKLGTRGQYGPAVALPVPETAPSNPRGIYEISCLTAEQIMQVYHRIHGIDVVLLRLSNVYGPRAQMLHPDYGVVNWFQRLAIDNETIKVFGDGTILRDFLFIDDCIDALLSVCASEETTGEVLNIGVDQGISFLELVETIIEITGSGKWEFAEFSPERRAQEPGDFFSDITKIKRLTGWSPKTSLKEGIRQTAEYYKEYKEHYWQ